MNHDDRWRIAWTLVQIVHAQRTAIQVRDFSVVGVKWIARQVVKTIVWGSKYLHFKASFENQSTHNVIHMIMKNIICRHESCQNENQNHRAVGH